MEAARKTARDHISRILRSVSHHITFLRHFVFVVLFLSTLRLQDGKINIVMYNEKRKHKGKQRFDFSFSTQVLGYTILLFSFILPSLFFLLFRFNFVLPYPFFVLCFVPVLSFFFFSFFLERL